MAVKQKKRDKIKKPTAKFSCLNLTKSTTQSIAASISPVYRVYKQFCEETTLHGLKHTVSDHFHWVERLLWLALTVAAFFGAIYCGLSQLTRYNSEPVVVSLQRDYRSWWTTFPAITACFIDRIEAEKAKEAIEDIWNVTRESQPERYQYYYNFVELVTDMSFRVNLQNFWKYQADETLKGVDLLELALSVHPSNPLKVMISKKDENKNVLWVPVMTEMGICLTFNSKYSQYQFLLEELPWNVDSIFKCHYHSGQCFVRIDSLNNAVKYYIHSPYDIPSSISNPTGEVSPGEELILDFKAVEIQASPAVKHLRPEQRRCWYPDEGIGGSTEDHMAYSFGLCQMYCRNRMALTFCGCKPFFHIKGDGDVCDAQGMACIGRNVEILINLPKNIAKCSCLPQCAELNYYSHTKTVVFRRLVQLL